MKVLKFGGSSLANIDLIKKVSQYIKEKLKEDEKLIVVASAMGKTTNELIAKMQESGTKINARELDQILATGEMQSVALIANCLSNMGVKTKSLSGWQAGIMTNGNYTDAEITQIEGRKIEKELKENDVLLVAGFQGVNNGEITTLGRGGSDTTAVALAAKFKCPCEIYTDVDGVYSVDPKIKQDAKKFSEISYDQMITMSKSGAKVLERRCSELAKKHNVDLYIGKSLETEKNGTKVVSKTKKIMKHGVASIAVRANLGIIKVLARTSRELNEINKKLSTLNCEQIASKRLRGRAIISAYFDKEKLEEIEKAFHDSIKKIKLGYCKVALIGCETKDEKIKALKQVKNLKHDDIFLSTLQEGKNYLSFAVEEKNGTNIVSRLSNSFEI